MLHKEFWGLLFLAFVGWIFISANPTERLDRLCRPVGWSGNIIVSLSAMAVPEQQGTVQSWFDKLEYGCQYTAWRLLYQSDWNKANPTAPAVTQTTDNTKTMGPVPQAIVPARTVSAN